MQRLQHLIVVIPGIGGSVLERPGGGTWELTTGKLVTTVIRPSTLSLDRFPEMKPTGLITTFTALGSVVTIPGYEGLTARLGDNFRGVVEHVHQPGKPIPNDVDVLLFPYDFRRSVTDAAERLSAAVHEALGTGGPRRVLVLAHSMGGLVARYWLGPLGGWRVCDALMTLGTPHRGAPKALEWLVRGPGLGPVRHVGVRDVLRGWPSVYELLPQYPAVWDAVAGREVELTALPGRSRYAGQFARMAAAGRRVHEDIADAWAAIPPGRVPEVLPFFGRGHATPNLATVTASGSLVITKEDPPWRGNVGWAGDGTVPVLSAIPRELGETRAVWRGTAERHGPLANTLSFLDPLRSYSGESLPTRGREAPTKPWLGLDVDDVVPANVEVPVSLTVHPEDVGAERVRITATPVPGGTPVFDSTMGGAGRTWRTTLPALRPGRYRLEFEARGAVGPDSVFADVDIVVLDADEEPAEAG
ncbi:lecithin:cholesterol acyltransferase [Saccharothrix carnea]|uniref:Lecithin:cholesterol acyltransferase n=1 Tax=Saccharothrix carnea TaxID=1280637 RepID=A0A2P8IBM4_SACCR|nr:hypothetical protein [Saccharothrix carnea]PSL55857.1 lecithin:cholesterol acyltransferase [Saccharothrix carnea]